MSTNRKAKRKDIPKRVYGYARVSTHNQDVENQRQAIQKYVEKNNLGDLLHIYCDEAVSGAKEFLHRKKGRMLADVLAPGDVVVVHRLDRLGRSLLDMIATVHTLIQQKISLHIVSVPVFGSMDMSTPHGRIVLAVLSIVADIERELIAERMAEGRRAAMAQGYSGGGGVPIGYKKIARTIDDRKRTVLEEDPQTKQHIHRILELNRNHGMGHRTIHTQLRKEGLVNPATGEPWSYTTIQKVIRGERK